jgi:hypothetical protein
VYPKKEYWTRPLTPPSEMSTGPSPIQLAIISNRPKSRWQDELFLRCTTLKLDLSFHLNWLIYAIYSISLACLTTCCGVSNLSYILVRVMDMMGAWQRTR